MSDSSQNLAVADSLTLFMSELGRYPLLTAAQEVELAKKIERGDRQAKERMINSNLRLVIYNARRYQRHGLPLEDVIQEGAIGLTRAVEKFDYRRGYKFSTYATWWIRQACQRAVANQSRAIRLPVHVDDRRRKLIRAREEPRAREEHSATHGREPTLDELADATALDRAHAHQALEAAEVSTSLNKAIGSSGTELGELLADPHLEQGDEDDLPDPRTDAVRIAVQELPEPQRSILSLRFGLTDGARTQEEIARALHTSPRRVRQLEQEALSSLKTALGRKTSGVER